MSPVGKRRAELEEAQHGYTLLEMLVVLAVLSLLIFISASSFSNMRPQRLLSMQVRHLEMDLQRGRALALSLGRPIDVIFDLDGRKWGVDKEPEVKFPPQLQVTVKTAAFEGLDKHQAGIRFFPDGTSSGGSITLSSQNHSSAIGIDWMTGRISVLK